MPLYYLYFLTFSILIDPKRNIILKMKFFIVVQIQAYANCSNNPDN